MKKKSLILALALVIILCSGIVSTIAWLSAKSPVVVNRFTVSDIEVELKETTGTDYQMIPGFHISKDPKATVLMGSQPCYLFIKLDKSDNFDDFLTYEIANGWTKLEGCKELVYYRIVDDKENMIGTSYNILKNDEVIVKNNVTNEQMNKIKDDESLRPTLTLTAYAFQLMKNNTDIFDALEAWNNLDK